MLGIQAKMAAVLDRSTRFNLSTWLPNSLCINERYPTIATEYFPVEHCYRNNNDIDDACARLGQRITSHNPPAKNYRLITKGITRAQFAIHTDRELHGKTVGVNPGWFMNGTGNMYHPRSRSGVERAVVG